MPRFAKGVLGTALLGLGLHGLVLVGGDHRLNAGLASNVLSICLAMLATSAALLAARIPDRYARPFWLLAASGFGRSVLTFCRSEFSRSPCTCTTSICLYAGRPQRRKSSGCNGG